MTLNTTGSKIASLHSLKSGRMRTALETKWTVHSNAPLIRPDEVQGLKILFGLLASLVALQKVLEVRG